jgi:hypothetical protein
MRAGQLALFVEGTIRSGRAQQLVADGELGAMAGRDLHQAACHVHRIAGRGDVVMAYAAEARGDDDSVMRADLESEF